MLFHPKSKFQKILEEGFPTIKLYIKENHLDELASDVVDDGVFAHSEQIYGEKMKPDERAFFFYYLINYSMLKGKYKMAADLHRNFVQEMIKCGGAPTLKNFIMTSVKPEGGAFSYAGEITIDELERQIEICIDTPTKVELEATLTEVRATYEQNKPVLQENWKYVQDLEEMIEAKQFIFKVVLNLIRWIAVIVGVQFLLSKLIL